MRAPCMPIVLCSLALAACGDDGEAERRTPDAARAVPSAVCSPVTYGGEGRPHLIVPLVGPMQNAYADHGVQNAQAAKLVLEQRKWRAGRFAVGVQACDEASADEPFDVAKCERTAKAFADNASIPVVVGPTVSSCAAKMIPVLNGARGGPVAMLGNGNTYVGLTREGPGVEPGHPHELYPTGERNYLRTAPADDSQAAAGALAAREAGAARVYALADGDSFGKGLAAGFAAAAERLGLEPVGSATWDPKAEDYRGLARRIARERADAVYLGGYVTSNGPRLVADLRDALGDAVLIGPDGFNQVTTLVEGAGRRADGLVITIAAAPVRALPAAGRTWAADYRRRFGAQPCCYAMHAAQNMQLALDAIAASADGSRTEVLDHLREARVRGGLIGDFSFDRHGDTTQTSIAVYRIAQGRLRYDRMLDVPTELLMRE